MRWLKTIYRSWNLSLLCICLQKEETAWLKSYHSSSPKYSDRQVSAISVDPDQTAPEEAF